MSNQKMTIYVVSEVWHGLASDVHVFANEEDALRKYHSLAAQSVTKYDDVQLFAKELCDTPEDDSWRTVAL